MVSFPLVDSLNTVPQLQEPPPALGGSVKIAVRIPKQGSKRSCSVTPAVEAIHHDFIAVWVQPKDGPAVTRTTAANGSSGAAPCQVTDHTTHGERTARPAFNTY